MAKFSGKSAIVTVDDSAGTPRTISADVVGYEIEDGAPGQDVTGFGEGNINYIPGQKQQKITLTVLWNTAATTGAMTVLRGIVGSTTSKTVTITPEGSGLAFSGEFMCEGITPSGSSDGSPISLGTVSFLPMGGVAAAWA